MAEEARVASVLIGRDRELEELEAFLDAAPKAPRALLLKGESGIGKTTLWRAAVVLVHEAYHLRRWAWRRNEAKVECQAIRHFAAGAQLLGASPQLANELLPFALAAYSRMGEAVPGISGLRVQAATLGPAVHPLAAIPGFPGDRHATVAAWLTATATFRQAARSGSRSSPPKAVERRDRPRARAEPERSSGT